MSTAIAIEDVTKRFGSVVAVDNLDLEVPRGSLYGFIGPNGSGKSTTLRMIMHILLPDEGEVEVLGQRDTRAAHDRVSYLPEERGLYKRMSVRRLLRYFGSLKGARQPELDQSIDIGSNGWGCRTGSTRRSTSFQGYGPEDPVRRDSAQQARSAHSRRALHRSGSGQCRGTQGCGARTEAGGDHGRLLNPRHVGRRASLRPDLHDLQGAQGARRHAR